MEALAISTTGCWPVWGALNKLASGASDDAVGPVWDPLHEQILFCCGCADCVVVHGHRHPQRRQRLLGRQRRKLGRGHRSRGFSGLRRRSWSLGGASSPGRRVCFRSISGGCLFSASASASDGGLCSGSGRLCAHAGGLRSRSRRDLCAGSCGVCAGPSGLRSSSRPLRSPVRLPRPLVSAAQRLLCAPSLGDPDHPAVLGEVDWSIRGQRKRRPSGRRCVEDSLRWDGLRPLRPFRGNAW
jgi:hypothetical protein